VNIDRRLLGWGAFFILVGTIPLAVRAGVLDATLVGRWASLWPLLLIGWGVGLVLRRTPLEWLGGAVTAITFGVMGGGLLATGFSGAPLFGGCGGGDGRPFEAQRGSIASPGQLNVEFNCGTLEIAPAAGTEWTVSGTESEGRAPRITTSGSSVSIEGAPGGGFLSGVGEARWSVGVPTGPSIGLGVTLNAGRGTADLTGASMSSVNLTVNAGSFELDLAGAAQLGSVNATVNAGEATLRLPSGERSVNLSLNAGSLDACMPAGSSVRIEWSGALGSNDLDDAGLTKVDDDTWVSPGFVEAQPHTEMHVSANAGSFDFDLRGACNG
jgi:hypothetical protein